jgi:hypothetical protein
MTRTLEVGDDGTLTLPADLLGDAPPHTRYAVETRDNAIVLRPEPATSPKPRSARTKITLPYEAWKQAWDAWAEQVDKAWKGEKSALEELAEMRR